MTTEAAESSMARAIELSRRGWPAPNPHVGCVVVAGGRVVGEGWHDHVGGPHAEVVALAQAGPAASGADLFVTLEPCHHHGRTPPCTGAVLASGIRRVHFACPDPNPRAAGGAQWLREAGVEVHVGLLGDQARRANEVFLTAMERRRPYLCLKAAVTMDGFMARPNGASKWITGDRAREAGRRLRAEMGCVLVGWRTVSIDDPQLTHRLGPPYRETTRVLLDPDARLSGGERTFREPGQVVWLVGQGRARDPRMTEGPLDIDAVLLRAFELGETGVLVEGGPTTLRTFAESRHWDRIEQFVGPKAFGDGLALRWPEGLSASLRSVERIGPDVRLTYENAATFS